ncbi:type VI secretion system tip protein VgrG [Ferruginibacter profundus]
MAATTIQSGGVATFIVKVDQSPISDTISVYAIQVEKMVNRVARAKIVILDGDPATGKFEASSSATFLPGAKISIEAGYDNKNKVIFSGIITGQSLRVDMNVRSMLEVECRDEAIKMIVDRKSLTYSKKKDSEIISSIISTYAGLSASVSDTGTVWPEQVQYYVTDWDYILSLAEANGLIVTTLNGKVSVTKPDADTSPVLLVNYGSELMEFNADLNAINQLGSVKASTWDFKNQQIISGQATTSVTGPGNLSTKKLSVALGLPDYPLQSTAPIGSGDLTTWSKAQLVKSEYSKITGEAKFQGTALVEPAKYITLGGLGTRFNGDYLVSGVIQNIADGNWLTDVTLGLSPNWFTQQADVMSPPASGLLPGARGLFNGTVKKMFGDPDAEYRILVDVPMFDTNGEGIWARLSNFYSTNGAGAFFLPELGDEVILGFLNEDPRYPVILGSMYSSPKQKPFKGLEPAEKNPLKAIVSKSGIVVKFDDENKELTIVTPGSNTVILSDKDKKITVKDQNSNSIVMSDSGIVMNSSKDITISAAQKLTLKGNQGVQIEASAGDVQVQGINIKETASAQYTAQGATAQVSGSGELTLKGGMIMIN